MGRKSINRIRKKNQEKTTEWIRQLYPYFQENGLRNITMDSVAKELQKSKTTVYDYFQTKEELLAEMLEFKLKELKGFEMILQDNKIAFLNRYYQAIEYLAKKMGDISNLFLVDLRDLYPELWQLVEVFLDEATNAMRDFYSEGILKGEFHHIHTSILVLSDQLFFRAIINTDFLTKEGMSLQEAFEHYMKLKCFGILKK